MQDDNSNPSNQFNNDGCQNPVLHQYRRTNYSRKRKHTQSQPKLTTMCESSLIGASFVDQSFWYDIRNFPDSLLIEILARLPVKSIFRFKCVCKHWQTLISHPSFRGFHSSILNANAASSLLPFRILYRYIYVSIFEEVLNRLRPEVYCSSKFSVLFLSRFEEQLQYDQFKVLSMSNGLILCCLLRPLIYYVCDPVTRQWVTLPRGRGKSPNRYPFFFGEGFVSRVNEDNMVTSYAVVRVELLDSPSNYLKLETFLSETAKWVGYMLPSPKPIRLLKRGAGPIHFNGVLHWFVYDQGMVAFDPYKDPKCCRIIQLPDDRDVESEYMHEGVYRLCDECQGTLRYFEVAHGASKLYCFSMWIMKDYDKGEWCCEFKVTRSDLNSSDPELSSLLLEATFLPLSFHPLNLNTVYLRCIELGCIVSYDIQNRRLDIACKPIGIFEDLSWRVVIPFVLPRWPMPLPKKVVEPRAPLTSALLGFIRGNDHSF